MSVSRIIDGLSIDNWVGQFSGAVDIEDDAENLPTEETRVWVVVAKTKTGAVTVHEKSGDVIRKNTIKVLDGRVVTDAGLRDVLVDRLGLDYGAELDFAGMSKENDAPAGVDGATGEVAEPPSPAPPAEEPEEQNREEEVQQLAPARSEGPKVGRFDADAPAGSAGVNERELVGSLYGPSGRTDKALEGFLTE